LRAREAGKTFGKCRDKPVAPDRRSIPS